MNKHHISLVVGTMPEASSLKFSVLAARMKNEGIDVITLSRGEAFFDFPMISCNDFSSENGYHYSDPQGTVQLREVVSRYYQSYGISANPESEILISSGSKIILFLSVTALINLQEEVIVLEPAWVSYQHQVRLAHGTPVSVPHNEDIKNIEKYITARTRAIIINNPNNPSGKVYSHEELFILSLLAKKHDLYIISDESYSEFISKEPFISIGKYDPDKQYTIIVNSFSKNLGLSGWRIGYSIANKELTRVILTLNQHLITCPATVLLNYLEKNFDKILTTTRPQIKRIMEEREEIARHMDSLGLAYLPGSGTFYFCVSIAGSKLGSEEFAEELLTRHSVAVVPGISYGKSIDQFVRISIGTESMDRVRQGLSMLKTLIQNTR